VLGAIKYH
jgi:hypothetical protein